MHECKVGFLYRYSSLEVNLVTVNDLIEHIEESQGVQEAVKDSGMEWLLGCSVYTLRDYGDRRKTTDLHRFDFCPECGKKINWKEIRNGQV